MDSLFELRAVRKQLRMTQIQVAERLGYSANTVARWERGELQIPRVVKEQIISWATDPAARFQAPEVPTVDSFHAEIVAGLAGYVDPAAFEACATDLLRSEWPKLAPVPGGSDGGFDGAVATDGESRPWPLVVTTAKNPAPNLKRSLQQATRKPDGASFAIFATNRRLTAAQREKLTRAADELGVALRQTYDGAWFANALYRNPDWCKRLLGLTGKPAALSALPVSPRPVAASEMLGRAAELKKLREAASDQILVGGPGIGKTTLLMQLVDVGFFLWGRDVADVASSIRQLNPRIIFVDDAHDNVAQLELLAGLRRQLGARFLIVASTWSAYLPQVRRFLPYAEEIVLRELDADLVADIVRAVEPRLPNSLVRHIVRQAEGRAGLAATLADLSAKGRFRDVLRGDALFEQLAVYTGSDRQLLGCFALSGETGATIETVATFLARAVDDVQRSLTHLAAAGIIRVDAGKHVSVWPKQLRHVLVRDTFFGGNSAMDFAKLLKGLPHKPAAMRTLIGASHCGAAVPSLRRHLEDLDAVELWEEYAWLDPSAASYVFEHHPDVLPEASSALLWHIPDRAIPKLLELAASDTAKSSRQADAMSALKQWLRGSESDGNRMVERSKCTVREAIRWAQRDKANVESATKAFCMALSLNFERSETDPGRGVRITITHGTLLDAGLQELAVLWSQSARDLLTLTGVPWSSVIDLLNEWVHPLTTVKLDASTLGVIRDQAERMMRDVLEFAAEHPGVRRRVAEAARCLGITLQAPKSGGRDSDFETLFPNRVWGADHQVQVEERSAAERRAREWAKQCLANARPGEVVRRVVALHAEAKETQVRSYECISAALDEVSAKTTDTREWFAELVQANADPSLLWPFIRREIEAGAPIEELTSVLLEPRYLSLVAEAAVFSPDASDESVSWAVANASNYLDAILGQCRVGGMRTGIVHRLLNHADERVRVGTAVAYYTQVKRDIDDELREAWRVAILSTASGVDVRAHDEYWLKQILTEDLDLGFEWLDAFATRHQPSRFSLREIALEVSSCLSSERKAQLLQRMKCPRSAADIVNQLVNGEPQLYELLLERDDLLDLHLEPLQPSPSTHDLFEASPMLRGNWPGLVCMALSRGFPEGKVFEALLPRSWGWSGSEVPLWEQWRDGFAEFESHSEPAVRRLAQRGRQRMQTSVDEAGERERIEAIRGID